jgi:hypothetical protein
VHIHATKSERAHARSARQLAAVRGGQGAPGTGGLHDVEGAARQFDVRVDLLTVQAAHEPLMLQLQQHLDEAGHTGGHLQVPDVGLDRAETAARLTNRRRPRLAQSPESTLESIDLHRVTELGARAMRLDVGDRIRVDSRLAVRLHQQRCLSLHVGRRETVRVAAVILGAGENETVDVVAGRFGGCSRLEHHDADAFATHVAIRAGVEGLAAAVPAQHAGR